MRFTGPAFGKSVGEPNRKVQGILNAVAGAQEGNVIGCYSGEHLALPR